MAPSVRTENAAMPSPPPLILASTSRYRRELLTRLQLPFDVQAPQTDETPLAQEAPAQLAERLALAKAKAVAALHPAAWVIGSDQVADLDGEPIGKPGTHEAAVRQLQAMSGRSVVFQTGLALIAPGFEQVRRVPVTVRVRPLQTPEIEAYLHLEQPYDCAGSAKSEGLGIALLEAIESNDPTALIGLPLIALCTLLRESGYPLLR
jgi:septum formation protein